MFECCGELFEMPLYYLVYHESGRHVVGYLRSLRPSQRRPITPTTRTIGFRQELSSQLNWPHVGIEARMMATAATIVELLFVTVGFYPGEYVFR